MSRTMKLTTMVFSLLLALGTMTVTAAAQQQGDRLSDDMIEQLVKHRLMRAGSLVRSGTLSFEVNNDLTVETEKQARQ